MKCRQGSDQSRLTKPSSCLVKLISTRKFCHDSKTGKSLVSLSLRAVLLAMLMYFEGR